MSRTSKDKGNAGPWPIRNEHSPGRCPSTYTLLGRFCKFPEVGRPEFYDLCWLVTGQQNSVRRGAHDRLDLLRKFDGTCALGATCFDVLGVTDDVHHIACMDISSDASSTSSVTAADLPSGSSSSSSGQAAAIEADDDFFEVSRLEVEALQMGMHPKAYYLSFPDRFRISNERLETVLQNLKPQPQVFKLKSRRSRAKEQRLPSLSTAVDGTMFVRLQESPRSSQPAAVGAPAQNIDSPGPMADGDQLVQQTADELSHLLLGDIRGIELDISRTLRAITSIYLDGVQTWPSDPADRADKSGSKKPQG